MATAHSWTLILSAVTFLSSLLLAQTSASKKIATPRFTEPSQAYEYAERPLREWEEAARAGKAPRSGNKAAAERERRAREWCPVFSVESTFGDNLYYLGKLCLEAIDTAKARAALSRYVLGEGPSHLPEARVLLMAAQRDQPAAAWETAKTMFREDPFGSDQYYITDSLIEVAADTDEGKALDMSRERDALLRNRTKPLPPESQQHMIVAMLDTVHRLYLSGQTAEAARTLADANRLAASVPPGRAGMLAQRLKWANMEMHPAPFMPALKMLGNKPISEVVQRGRVEVVSFFFMGCPPCIAELPHLEALQRRYRDERLFAAAVTTYKLNQRPKLITATRIEAALGKMRRKKCPNVQMVLTTDEALRQYAAAFPLLLVIDKAGTVRHIVDFVSEDEFDENGKIDRLVRQLIHEPNPEP